MHPRDFEDWWAEVVELSGQDRDSLETMKVVARGAWRVGQSVAVTECIRALGLGISTANRGALEEVGRNLSEASAPILH